VKDLATPVCPGMDPYAISSRVRPNGADACSKMMSGNEGWVELGFMVDPGGKPFEITVVRSTGDKTFDMTAMKAIERSTFFPGSLDGKPVESGYELRYVFLSNVGGPSQQFTAAYEALLRAVNAADKTAADAALAKLKITTLSEDAYFGLATYFYASKWGDGTQQLEALTRAIVQQDRVQYLSKDQFKSAMLTRLKLEMKARQFAEALTTWKGLEKVGVDKSTEALVLPMVDQLQKLRSDDSSYAVAGLLTSAGSWHLHLFKRHFEALVSDGYISQVKLRCDKHYVFFTFDPTIQYKVDAKYGDCAIELLGAPGTHFQLVQS
jgi:TonB family protein